MLDSLRDNHREILATIFAATVILAAWLEVFFPRRPLVGARSSRWVPNLALGTFNTLLFMLALPFAALTGAIIAADHAFGLLRVAPWPEWVAIPLGVLAVDLFVYVGHRLMHAMPILWRLHQVHHSDTEIDFTTTFRHHPLEALATAAMVFTACLVFGVSPESVIIHQIAATAFDVMSHGNVRLSPTSDGYIRRLFVTPDMHLVHHSARKAETDSNFGTVLSVWDRLLGTYVASPAGGPAGMTIGLEYYRARADQHLLGLLRSPIMKPPHATLASAPVTLMTP